MVGRRRAPDHEASGIEVSADRIDGPHYYPRSKKDGGSYAKARGDVVVTVRKQHSGSKDDGTNDRRAKAGTVFDSPGKDSEITVSGRRIEKVRRKNGRDNTTVSGGVEIFGRMRRRKQ